MLWSMKPGPSRIRCVRQATAEPDRIPEAQHHGSSAGKPAQDVPISADGDVPERVKNTAIDSRREHRTVVHEPSSPCPARFPWPAGGRFLKQRGLHSSICSTTAWATPEREPCSPRPRLRDHSARALHSACSMSKASFYFCSGWRSSFMRRTLHGDKITNQSRRSHEDGATPIWDAHGDTCRIPSTLEHRYAVRLLTAGQDRAGRSRRSRAPSCPPAGRQWAHQGGTGRSGRTRQASDRGVPANRRGCPAGRHP